VAGQRVAKRQEAGSPEPRRSHQRRGWQHGSEQEKQRAGLDPHKGRRQRLSASDDPVPRPLHSEVGCWRSAPATVATQRGFLFDRLCSYLQDHLADSLLSSSASPPRSPSFSKRRSPSWNLAWQWQHDCWVQIAHWGSKASQLLPHLEVRLYSSLPWRPG